ncbi:unnamed protein product [Cunninghamella blakesleeana]
MVGKIATAFFLALGFIQTAFAANGHIHVNGVQLNKHTGCTNVAPVHFSISQAHQLSIENEADKPVHVFDDSDCSGKSKVIIPGKSYLGVEGRSHL